MSRRPIWIAALWAAACTAKPANVTSPGAADAGPMSEDARAMPEDAGPPPVIEAKRSGKARVRFKGQQRLANDLSRALELATNELCNEVGKFNCLDVHAIPLGGVEPYLKGIFEPLPKTTVTTPLAVERLVLSACSARVRLDGGRPDGIIFRDIQLTPEIALADPTQPELREAFERLYERMLQRRMTDEEWAHLFGLYGEIVAVGDPAPAATWAALGCFAVGTSMEALFY